MRINHNGNTALEHQVRVEKLEVYENTPGIALSSRIYQADNSNSSSHAALNIRTGGSTGGDPVLSLGVANVGAWQLGFDNSDADKLKINWNNITSTPSDAKSRK